MPADVQPRAASALGVTCYAGDLEGAADEVIARAASRSGGHAVLCNVHVLITALREPPVRAALDDAWRVFPDGAPVAWLLRRSGAPHARRIGGPDLMRAVLARGRTRGLRHVLFGSTEDVLDALLAALERDLPGVNVVGSYAPPFGTEDAPDALERITRAEPDVVWVALGAPKQERWMNRHAASLHPAVALGVGAAFDFHAGTKPRAPRWMQRTGLEWLHRLGSEPRRLGWRYLTTNTRFLVLVARERTRRASRRRPGG
jgi:N-acetylglucosaminyldiphosphoundecaprenol N-acetyl-beta-D-mannosaminyltransferase